jgi:hypothetical protein
VSSSPGLDDRASGEDWARAYVAGWGEAGALDAVCEFASTIDRLARRIEDAITQPQTAGVTT